MSLNNCIKVLTNNSLKFSSPLQFNDPYDCHFVIDGYTEDIRKWAKEASTSEAQFELFSLISKQPLPEITKAVYDATTRIGICCFSRSYKNLLMWAHYADKHKGVCLKFDISKDKDLFDQPYLVKYRSEYMCLDVGKVLDVNYIMEAFSYKSSQWKHEREVRFFQSRNGFKKFNKNALRSIYLGYKMQPSNINTIKILSSKEFDYSVDLYKTSIDERRYKLNFKQSTLIKKTIQSF